MEGQPGSEDVYPVDDRQGIERAGWTGCDAAGGMGQSAGEWLPEDCDLICTEYAGECFPGKEFYRKADLLAGLAGRGLAFSVGQEGSR